MEIKYQEHDIDDIFKYFVHGFAPSPGKCIYSFTANYDPRTGKVIFKLYVGENEPVEVNYGKGTE